MFRYLLKFPDGVLHHPVLLVSAVPFWLFAETLRLRNGQLLRIVALNTEIHHSLIEAGINGVFTVEQCSDPRGETLVTLTEGEVLR